MRKIAFIFTITSFLLLSQILFAQVDCKKYYEKKCDFYGTPFKLSSQSKSAMFELGQKSQFQLAVFGGFEYRVSLCADKNLEGVFFRIREANTNKNVLYDSSSEIEDNLEKMFIVENSKNLIIEVVVPESDIPREQQSYKDRFGCIGVTIEYFRRSSSGFD